MVVYDFSVDYNATDVDDISDIPKYLMNKMTQCNEMFGVIKKRFFTGLASLSTLKSVNSLSCISLNNQERKVRSQIVNVNSDEPVFFLLVLKKINAVVVVTILMTHMRKCVFLML